MPRLLLTVLVFLLGQSIIRAQFEVDELEDDSPYASGVVLHQEGNSYATPHVFLSRNKDARTRSWAGYLESDIEGNYRLAAKFTGELEIQLNGRIVLRGSSEVPLWLTSNEIPLSYAHHPIRVTLKPTANGRSSITTFWSGPNFRYEPLPVKVLWHERGVSQKDISGHTLFRRLRCDACHTIDGIATQPLRSPELSSITPEFTDPAWLETFFVQASKSEDPIVRIHGLPRAADELIGWLYEKGTKDSGAAHDVARQGNTENGEALLHTVGCLACHQYRGLGQESDFGGGDLTEIGDKRTQRFLQEWLSDPAKLNANHRMPKFDLRDQEVLDIAAFLSVGVAQSPNPRTTIDSTEATKTESGKVLFEANSCAHCHGSHDQHRSQLSAESNWVNSCVSASPKTGQPDYQLSANEIKALKAFVANPADRSHHVGDQLLAENNCMSCHARGDMLGLATVSQSVVNAHPRLVDQLGKMKPPALNSIGDKLHARVLRRSITRDEQPRRPWLSVRMPKFPLSDGDVEAIADHFIAQDRVPNEAFEDSETQTSQLPAEEQTIAGRMVTSDGFGCASCHQIGKVKPPEKTPVNQLAPNLSMPSERMRKIWFDRWVRNPARITPKMEMPSVQVPIPHVLDGDLDRQLNAVWSILNERRFNPPDPSPTRVVRRTGAPGELAAVLTDVISFNGRKLIKPFLIGLPNRHNILLDLEEGRLASWWTGDTARQRTQGKTWYWESSSLQTPETKRRPELVLSINGETLEPYRDGQSVAELDGWKRTANGVEMDHRLRFMIDEQSRSIFVTQQFVATPNGWMRKVRAEGLPANARLALRSSLEASADEAVGGLQFAKPASAGTATLELSYIADSPDTGQPAKQTNFTINETKQLDVMPGFRATQLPVRADVMPISLAWRPNGQLIVGSLKGRVWTARDADGDGLEDTMTAFSDDLASPYGIQATNEYVDVVVKYGVVRCFDDNNDGLADRHEIVASGWGHTDDYHDWIVGLPKDEAGNYFISIPCQQDDRSLAAAQFRGRVLRLAPRIPTTKNPRLFELKEISAGHRFPMGIARNASGQLFVTDNQGNYNPFNELNHVVEGAHFGFINKVEREGDYRPPLTEPTIDIPHPWTRSVNGICFLETPAQLQPERGDLFGPFEGQLLGCEYDTRRLVRMSLQSVNGRLQGAIYPFAEAANDPAKGFQGPINCGVAPDGDIYIANIRDSGWGGANNTGSLVRIAPDLDALPCGIAEVKAMARGFRVRFTRPISKKQGSSLDHYNIASYRRVSTPAYGGDDVDRRQERISSVKVADDRMSVDIELSKLRAGFVYAFRLQNLADDSSEFYPAEAFYTLRQIPKSQ